MKTFILSFCFFLLSFCSKGQDTTKMESLNAFFAGIPLKQGFAKWMEYLYNHPYMGIDSADYNFIVAYSSLKPGIKSHFPFPDSVLVKIIAVKQIRMNYNRDSIFYYSLLVEGVFGNKKPAKKAAIECFAQLDNLFKPYYKKNVGVKSRREYSKGKNENFPDFSMERGFFPKFGFYYVTITYVPEK